MSWVEVGIIFGAILFGFRWIDQKLEKIDSKLEEIKTDINNIEDSLVSKK